MGGVGTDGDDGAAPLLLEVGHQGPQQIEDAAGVDRHAVVPVVIAQSLGGAEAQDPAPFTSTSSPPSASSAAQQALTAFESPISSSRVA